MNKRGDIFQLIFLLVIVFAIAMIGVVFFKITHSFTTTLDDSGIFSTTPAANKANVMMSGQSRTVPDEMVFFMFLGSMIALLVAAGRTNFSPTVIFLFILLLLMAVFIAGGLVEIYQGTAQSDSMQPEGSQLTLTNIILSRYTPLIICVLGAIILIIMYGKSGSDIGL